MTTYIANLIDESGEGTADRDVRTLTFDQLEALRPDAGINGDYEMVATIDRVLSGDLVVTLTLQYWGGEEPTEKWIDGPVEHMTLPLTMALADYVDVWVDNVSGGYDGERMLTEWRIEMRDAADGAVIATAERA